MDRYRLTFDRDENTAGLAGCETGELTLVAIRGDIAVVKEAGHRYWSAHHEPHSYAPAQFRVFRLTECLAGRPDNWWAEELVAFPARGVAPRRLIDINLGA